MTGRAGLGAVVAWCAVLRGIWLPAWTFYEGDAPDYMLRIVGNTSNGEWLSVSKEI